MLIPIHQLEECTNTSLLPRTPGLYFVYHRDSLELEKPVYIGSATGKSGLYGRIHAQHVNESYTETRFSKTTKTDAFQVTCNMFNKQGKQYIDKSSLRKAIGRYHQIAPGKDTAQYIKDNLVFYVLNPSKNQQFKDMAIQLISSIIPDVDLDLSTSDTVASEVMKGAILSVENLAIGYYQPFYNTQNKA
ncbi:hypothetical protein AB4374_12230 [Vibrio splendidus]